MCRIALAALVAATLTALAAPAGAQQLKFDVEVAASEIRLADLFAGLERHGDLVVGRAPAPGQSVVFDAPTLERIARAYGIAWRPLGWRDQAVVRRAGTRIDRARVRAVLEPALARLVPADRLEITLDGSWAPLHVPAEAETQIRAEALRLHPRRDRFSAEIVVESGAERVRRPVSGTVVATIEVPVLVRWVRPGEPIGRDDIAWRAVNWRRQASDTVTTEDQLVGRTPRRFLAVDKPVRLRDLEVPRMVTKGQFVTIVLATPYMQLTARGRALDHGAEGELIRVANTQSSRIIEARVAGPSQVVVPTPTLILN